MMKNITENMRWYDWLQFGAMAIMSAAVPVSMNLGLWAAMLLLVASLTKAVAMRRVGNRALSRPVKAALCGPMVYWLCLLVGALVGGGMETGLHVVRLKATMLIFPVAVMVADTSSIKGVHLRLMFYALWAACMGVFLYFSGVAVDKMLSGSELASVVNNTFDPRHHAYTAMYAVAALAFVYVELRNHSGSLRPWLRWLLIVSVPLLVLYIVIVNSRAGIIILWAMLALAAVDGVRHNWWKTLIVMALMAGWIVLCGAMLPGHKERVTSTISAVSEAAADTTESADGDVRITILKSALEQVQESPVVGHGTGNYREELVRQYEADAFEHGVDAEYNAHNQYVESLLATGVFGLIALLYYLFAPLVVALTRARGAVLPLLFATGIVAGNLLVESMLERQMGLLFIGWFMTLMVLVVNSEENKFCGKEK